MTILGIFSIFVAISTLKYACISYLFICLATKTHHGAYTCKVTAYNQVLEDPTLYMTLDNSV
jgi:hypothetical protein